jgi:hypothetical protein
MVGRGHLCTYCGVETTAPQRPGSNWIALALSVPFVVPGAIYLAWRYTTRRLLCPICAHAALIPADAPLARTWRSAGWLAGQVPGPGPTVSDSRIERIEQAIDAIAMEVDRVTSAQRLASSSALAPRDPGAPRL